MTAQTQSQAAADFPVYLGYTSPNRCPTEAITDAACVIQAMNTLLNGFSDLNDLIRAERDGIFFIFDAVQQQIRAAASRLDLPANQDEGKVYPHFNSPHELASKPHLDRTNLAEDWDKHLWKTIEDWAALGLVPADMLFGEFTAGFEAAKDTKACRKAVNNQVEYHLTTLPQCAQDEFNRRAQRGLSQTVAA